MLHRIFFIALLSITWIKVCEASIQFVADETKLQSAQPSRAEFSLPELDLLTVKKEQPIKSFTIQRNIDGLYKEYGELLFYRTSDINQRIVNIQLRLNPTEGGWKELWPCLNETTLALQKQGKSLSLITCGFEAKIFQAVGIDFDPRGEQTKQIMEAGWAIKFTNISGIPDFRILTYLLPSSEITPYDWVQWFTNNTPLKVASKL